MTKLLKSPTSKIKSELILVVLTATLLTFVFLWSIITHFTTHLTSHQDGLLIAWIINQVSQAIRTGNNIYQLPFFLPFENTLTFSDPFVSTALFNLPLSILNTDIVTTHNLHLVGGTIITFVSMYFLTKQITDSKIASLAAAIFFTFSSLHLHYLIHLHTYLIAGIPLGIFFLLKWQNSKKIIFFILWQLCFLYQTLNAPLTGFFFITSSIFFLDISQFKLKEVAISLLTLLITLTFYWPYFQTSQNFAYTRTIRDAAHFAHSINRFWDLELLIIYGLTLLAWHTAAKRKNHKALWPSIGLCITGAVLSLGPALKVDQDTFKIFSLPIPLPYAVLYYIVPGFKAFRASSRWIIVFNLGLSLLLGTELARSKLSVRHKLLILLFLTQFLYFYNVPKIKLFEIPTTIPAIYKTVTEQPQQNILELPAYVWGQVPQVTEESNRLLYQTYHHKNLYNGYSGFTPPVRENDFLWLTNSLLDEKAIQHLQAAKIELVVVHLNQYQYQTAEEVKQTLDARQSLELLRCAENICLYKITSN